MTTHQKLYIRIWQHEVVRRNESDQVEGKSDQVGTILTKLKINLTKYRK